MTKGLHRDDRPGEFERRKLDIFGVDRKTALGKGMAIITIAGIPLI